MNPEDFILALEDFQREIMLPEGRHEGHAQ